MLKKIGLIILCWTYLGISSAVAYGENWEISDFNSQIEIQANGTVIVTETIVADFTNEAHRGIERSIPFKYANDYNAQITLLETNDWDVYEYRDQYYLNIQLSTPDSSQLNDKQTYIIKYQADNVISFFDQHDELSWNVTGNEWAVPIKNVKAKITVPQGTKIDNSICFTGIFGSTATNCEVSREEKIATFSARDLKAYEGLTTAIKMPAGSITPPSKLEKIFWFIRENPGVVFPPIALIIMLGLYFKKGRDDQSVSDTIMPHYRAPKELSPTEVGTIIDETLDPRDITATIIDFAIRGYIKINELSDEDYELKLLKPYETEKEFERLVLGGIFTDNKTGEKTKISELENKFYLHIPKIRDSVMDKLVLEDYFPKAPNKIRKNYALVGGFFIFIGISGQEMASFAAGIIISGIIIAGIGYFMPRKTKKGTESYYVLKGLYEFIDTAEKDRLKFQEDNNIIFEKVLPYAMAFGIAKKWAKAFDGLIEKPPSWYHGNYNTFNMINFSNALGKLDSRVSNKLSSTPGKSSGGSWSGGSSFGGGGFSGGGFGGGGGRGL